MSITFDKLINVVNNNEYVRKCRSNPEKSFFSLSYLIDMNLSQSDCIKMGHAMEKVIMDIGLLNPKINNIKQKNEKGKKETDILLCDEENKIIYYAELKANIELDTEKYAVTCEKCLEIVSNLETLYPEYTVKWCLLGYRHKHSKDIPSHVYNKYSSIQEHLYGINQFLIMLNIDCAHFDDVSHKMFVNHVANECFKDKHDIDDDIRQAKLAIRAAMKAEKEYLKNDIRLAKKAIKLAQKALKSSAK